jgi:hypothetical protein
MAPDDPVWVEFARHMAPHEATVAQAIAAHFAGSGSRPAGFDIAAGHGLFGIAFARQFPDPG